MVLVVNAPLLVIVLMVLLVLLIFVGVGIFIALACLIHRFPSRMRHMRQAAHDRVFDEQLFRAIDEFLRDERNHE